MTTTPSDDKSPYLEPENSPPGAAPEELPDRRHPAHGVRINILEPTIVFVTVCTKNRKPILATEANHNLLRIIWHEARAWLVGRYVIMPDHIHLFAAPGESDIKLDNWIRYWKSLFTQRCQINEFRWQSDHWDTRLRSSESYDSRWQYVVGNAVRHKLVTDPKDWPFQGEINVLPWY